MEFNQKLQELRKQKGLTQEELAESLFVSRTAVSKWELGRGYPNLESLKDIAKFFSITIDELLSGSELLTVAEQDNKRKESRVRNFTFGILDIAIAILFFLPFFAQRTDGNIYEVSLLRLTQIAPYLKISYFVIVITLIVVGVATLILQNCTYPVWLGVKHKLSLFISALGIALFVVGLQPYPAILLFVFVSIKALILIKWQ